MQLLTQVSLPNIPFEITHNDTVIFWGSCFVENIGKKFDRYLFPSITNPFGTVYNPASIAKQIDIVLSNKIYTEADLFTHNGLYFSFDHHSSFSDIIPKQTLTKINTSLSLLREKIRQVSVMFFTFGTAWVYEYKKPKQIVSNCHKIPTSKFNRFRLEYEKIVFLIKSAISKIREINGDVKIVFTVSPIRHWKDGAVENTISKSTLHLAIHKIIKEVENTYYFPSYEIVMDELRDYRFYAPDMLHLNEVAIEYIWEKFSDTFFNQTTKNIIHQIEKIQKGLEHKPFFKNSIEYREFVENLKRKILLFEKQYPYINTQSLKVKIIDK